MTTNTESRIPTLTETMREIIDAELDMISGGDGMGGGGAGKVSNIVVPDLRSIADYQPWA